MAAKIVYDNLVQKVDKKKEKNYGTRKTRNTPRWKNKTGANT